MILKPVTGVSGCNGSALNMSLNWPARFWFLGFRKLNSYSQSTCLDSEPLVSLVRVGWPIESSILARVGREMSSRESVSIEALTERRIVLIFASPTLRNILRMKSRPMRSTKDSSMIMLVSRPDSKRV